MIKYFKPARDPQRNRGFFSYITESVIDIGNVYKGDLNQNIEIYFDLVDIPGYVKGNIFDVCFLQNNSNYFTNKNEFLNIEKTDKYLDHVDPYNNKTWDLTYREYTEKIIKKHFILNESVGNIYSDRVLSIPLDKTVGVHRRSTDISMHDYEIISVDSIFEQIESTEFENVFLLCDNLNDLKKFQNRYGNRLITYDEETTSQDIKSPFHKNHINNESLREKHIQEIVLGSFLLSRTKEFICCNSNLSNFVILSNSKLNYKLLN